MSRRTRVLAHGVEARTHHRRIGRFTLLVSGVCILSGLVAACSSSRTTGAAASPTSTASSGVPSSTAAGPSASSPVASSPVASSTAASSTLASTPAASSDSIVTQAKLAVNGAIQGLVYSSVDVPTSPSDFQPYGSWRGPTTAPPPVKNALVEIIPCTMQAPSCATAAESTAAAVKALGWRSDIITSGAVNPEQAAQAFNVALSRKPQAIIGIAVDAALAPQQIAAAEKAGIVTVEEADDRQPSEQVAYDAYVSDRQPLEWALDAYAIIADSNGTANALGIDITDVAGLHGAYGEFKSVMAQCTGCKLTTISMTVAQLGDPTAMQQVVGAALAAHPAANYFQMTAAEGLPPVLAAIRQASRQNKIMVLVEDADPAGLNAITQGEASYDPGFSLGWLGYAGVDEVERGLGKAPYLTTAQIGMGLHMFSASTTPASGNADDYSGYKAYAAEYEKLWGIGG
jgi:ABC-type sugar transport system substrate-binding protein